MIKRIDFTVDYISDIVIELEQDDLILFLKEYNNYVQDFYEEHDEGSTPVSIIEFFNNDYPLILEEKYPKANFFDDTEKMIDFLNLSKTDFLQHYSYLTKEEYDNTLDMFIVDRAGALAGLYREAENCYIEELNDREIGMNLTSNEMKIIITQYANNCLSIQEYEEFCELCNSMGC